MYDAGPALLGLPDSFTTAQALAAGLPQRVVERLVRNGELRRLRPGLFLRAQPAVGSEGDERWEQILRSHLAQAKVALLAHPHHALSHRTGAAARGWPITLHPDEPVHLTTIHVEPRSRRVGDRFPHHSDSILNDVELVEGMPALAAARTVADCLRTMRRPSGVAVADGAIRAGATTLDDVRTMLDSQRGWLGRPQACSARALIDPRRESWLESYSFVTLCELGVELPVPQVEVFDERRRFVARADGMWISDGTVAEVDGAGKYLRGADDEGRSAGRSAAERVVDERKRERRLLDLGLQVVRWDNHDIRHLAADVVRRVGETRAEGDIRRFRGHLRVGGIWLDLTEHAAARDSGVSGRQFARRRVSGR